MPIIANSTFSSPRFLFNGHLQTIIPYLLRKVEPVNYRRERIFSPDDDFIDLDWSEIGSDRLVIISHGLEGDTNRKYMKGMVKKVNEAGFDALAWNCRGCSGELNKQIKSYHMGATEDLNLVISQIILKKKYKKIHLIGFSLGGNLVLKYLGEKGSSLPKEIDKAVAFSVPCDLLSTSIQFEAYGNYFYLKKFLKTMKEKIRKKHEREPHSLNIEGLKSIKNFRQFDEIFTAPLNGFESANDYYEKCSSLKSIPFISIPTLIINAQNDPFLTKACFPIQEAQNSKSVFLEMPVHGGHVGFLSKEKNIYWSEERAIHFILHSEILPS